MDNKVKDGFQAVKNALRYFEITLATVPLKPDGEASSMIAMMRCHKELSDTVERYEMEVEK